jgi:hypothetical protein
VEVTLSRAGERTLVGLVNHTAALVRSEAPIPAGPVTVRLPGNPLASARPLRGSRCHLVDDGRVLRVECVETFELIELG